MGPIYPVSAHQLSELDKYLKNILAEGKIADGESPYRALILLVPKPNGSLRLCVDYIGKKKRLHPDAPCTPCASGGPGA